MSLDPNFILQMVLRKRAEEASLEREQMSNAESRRQQQFNLGLQVAQNPHFNDIDAFLGIAPDLTPAQTRFLQEQNKALGKQRKAQEIATGAGAAAAASPVGGGASAELGFQPTLPEVLQSLRSVESQAGGDPRLLEESLRNVDILAQANAQKARQADLESARIAGRGGADEGIELRRETLQTRRDELEARREQNKINRISTERSKYEKFSKPFLDTFDAMQSVEANAAEARKGNANAAVNLVYARAKAADRGGRVTQQDFDVQARNGAYGARVQAWYKMALTGNLTEQQIQNIVGTTKAEFTKREKEFQRYSDGLEKSLRKQGIDPEDVMLARPPSLSEPLPVPAGLPAGTREIPLPGGP